MIRQFGFVLFALGLTLFVEAMTTQSYGSTGLATVLVLSGLVLAFSPQIRISTKPVLFPLYKRLKLRFQPRIAILKEASFPFQEDRHKAATRFGPEDWLRELTDLGLRARLVPATSRWWSRVPGFDFVVNPYGEVYVEADPVTQPTLQRIVRYIQGGGVYCQVGGAGFYYTWDAVAQRRIPTPPESDAYELYSGKTFVPTRLVGYTSLVDTPLANRFGISTTGGEKVLRLDLKQDENCRLYAGELLDQEKVVYEFRSARAEVTKAMIPLAFGDWEGIANEEKIHRRFFPLILVPLGFGALLHGGMDLKGDRAVDGGRPTDDADDISRNAFRLSCRAIKNLIVQGGRGRYSYPLRRGMISEHEHGSTFGN